MDFTSAKIFSNGISRFADYLYKPGISADNLNAFRDAMSEGQLSSKLHLVEAAANTNLQMQKSFFIGHWHGLLPFFFLKTGLVKEAKGMELDQKWVEASSHVCWGLNWSSIQGDATKVGHNFYLSEGFDSVFNTSCEHMNFDWLYFAPKGMMVLAQATDYKIDDHVNPQQSLIEFESHLRLSEVLHRSELDFNIYKRFTIIGRI